VSFGAFNPILTDFFGQHESRVKMVKYLLIAYSIFYLLSSCSCQHLKILYQNDSGDNEIIRNVTHLFDPVELDEQKKKWQASNVSAYTIYYEMRDAFRQKQEVVKVMNGKVIGDRGISIDKLFADLGKQNVPKIINGHKTICLVSYSEEYGFPTRIFWGIPELIDAWSYFKVIKVTHFLHQ